MRKAILEGIKTDVFAKPNLPMLGQYGPGGPMYPPGKIFSNSRDRAGPHLSEAPIQNNACLCLKLFGHLYKTSLHLLRQKFMPYIFKLSFF